MTKKIILEFLIVNYPDKPSISDSQLATDIKSDIEQAWNEASFLKVTPLEAGLEKITITKVTII